MTHFRIIFLRYRLPLKVLAKKKAADEAPQIAAN
jgi:hypothetical protein